MRFIGKMISRAGPDALSAILGQKYAGKKWDGIVQLADSLNIPTPNIVSKIEKARKKLQGKFQDHAKLLEKNLPVEALVLKEGFLRNEDESESAQIQRISPSTSGVVLARYDEAKLWLDNGGTITQDELTLIVVGQCFHAQNIVQRSECQCPCMKNHWVCLDVYTIWGPEKPL